MKHVARAKLIRIYKKLYRAFGPQGWWPGKTPFEVMAGAILTQNTNWANVEKAIKNLKSRRLLFARTLQRMPQERLAKYIRPAGYFNIKAKRLKHFLDFFVCRYGADIKKLSSLPVEKLRHELLAINGIGQETADSILLYALEKPVFVVDAYTKRILLRHKLIDEGADYQAIQEFFMHNLKDGLSLRNKNGIITDKRVRLFNEYHALLVRLAKDFCLKSKPRCITCPLGGLERNNNHAKA